MPAHEYISKPGADGQTSRTTTAERKEERVELTGRVGRTPTFHTTAKGTLIASFPVAVHLEDGSTTWHKIAAFKDKARKLQEQVAQGKVTTGKEVDVVGYVHYREKQSKKGTTTQVAEIWTAAPVRPR